MMYIALRARESLINFFYYLFSPAKAEGESLFLFIPGLRPALLPFYLPLNNVYLGSL
jgi:hypothetical protein